MDLLRALTILRHAIDLSERLAPRAVKAREIVAHSHPRTLTGVAALAIGTALAVSYYYQAGRTS